MIWRSSSGISEVHPATPLPSVPDSPSFVRIGGKPPGGSRGMDRDDYYCLKSCKSKEVWDLTLTGRSQRRPGA